MEDSFDIELAKKAADDCNRTIGNIKVEIDDDRSCAFGCMTFADDIDTLSAALPHMILYLEQGRVAFLQFYQKNLSERMNALLPPSPIKS